MSKTKKIVIVVSLVAILAVIVVGASFIFYRGNTYGITHGTYGPIDENGKLIDTTQEYNWRFDKDSATYMYAEGKLILENDKIYYYYDTTITIDKYEITYDKKTKILTVYMPEIYPDKGEIKAFKFKRKTIFN